MKKLTSAVLVGVLCAGVLTACGSKQSTDTTNTSVSTTESQSSGQSSDAIVKIVSLNVNNNLDKHRCGSAVGYDSFRSAYNTDKSYARK